MTKLTQANRDVVSAIIKAGKFTDGHNGGRDTISYGGDSPWQLVLFKNQICPVKTDTVTCLNPIEMVDSVPTLSRWSIGGNVDCRNLSLVDAVHVFNNEIMWDDKSRDDKITLIDLSEFN